MRPLFVKVLPGLSLAIFAALAGSAVAQSQSYPVKAIRLVVPLAPGGGNDMLARYVGKYLTESLGQSVVIENRPGGGGSAGGEYVARAASQPGTGEERRRAALARRLPARQSVA